MCRRLLLIVSILALVGCGDDDTIGERGPAGPSGQDAGPKPIKVLVLGSDTSWTRAIAAALYGDGGVNPNTVIDHLDVSSTVPTLGDLFPYHAILFYSSRLPSDPDAVGNVLARYVDTGGKLVMAQGSFSTNTALAGGAMFSGYTPYGVAGAALDGSDRVFLLSSLPDPPSPIFSGINPSTFRIPGNLNHSNPPLLGSTTNIAMFTNGHNAIAANAAGSVMGLNLYPDRTRTDVMRLIGNMIHEMTDAW